MNIKFKNFKDLIDDTPFTKKDIVCIQDPHNIEKYNASNYHHVKNDLRLVDAPDSDEEEVSPLCSRTRIVLGVRPRDGERGRGGYGGIEKVLNLHVPLY